MVPPSLISSQQACEVGEVASDWPTISQTASELNGDSHLALPSLSYTILALQTVLHRIGSQHYLHCKYLGTILDWYHLGTTKASHTLGNGIHQEGVVFC